MIARLPARLFVAFALGAVIAAAGVDRAIGQYDTPAPYSTPVYNTPAPTTPPAPASTGSPAPAASPIMVYIRNFAFVPSSLTIKVGQSVTWRNDDQASHTVTSDKGLFDTNLDRGVVFTYTFTKEGKYAYTCRYHPYMTGTITVTK